MPVATEGDPGILQYVTNTRADSGVWWHMSDSNKQYPYDDRTRLCKTVFSVVYSRGQKVKKFKLLMEISARTRKFLNIFSQHKYA